VAPLQPSHTAGASGDAFADRVSVVIVAFGADPWLVPSVDAVLSSAGVTTDVIVVDNGGTGGLTTDLAKRDRVTIIGSGDNIGFAAGCNLGVAHSKSPLVALINPDARVEPRALAELAHALANPEVGIATASVRLAENPELLNSAGNAIHFLGISWSGNFKADATDHNTEVPVTAASGAAMMMRRSTWIDLGGLTNEFFAYYEDAELSLRCWQRGLSVIFVPTAVVVHRYEFSRNPLKYQLLERNRLILVLTTFGTRHLVLMAPAFLAIELAIVATAAAQGWLGPKLKGYVWLARNVRWIRQRRRSVQNARTVSDSNMAPLFASKLQPENLPPPKALQPFDRLLVRYWAVARRFL